MLSAVGTGGFEHVSARLGRAVAILGRSDETWGETVAAFRVLSLSCFVHVCWPCSFPPRLVAPLAPLPSPARPSWARHSLPPLLVHNTCTTAGSALPTPSPAAASTPIATLVATAAVVLTVAARARPRPRGGVWVEVWPRVECLHQTRHCVALPPRALAVQRLQHEGQARHAALILKVNVEVRLRAGGEFVRGGRAEGCGVGVPGRGGGTGWGAEPQRTVRHSRKYTSSVSSCRSCPSRHCSWQFLRRSDRMCSNLAAKGRERGGCGERVGGGGMSGAQTGEHAHLLLLPPHSSTTAVLSKSHRDKTRRQLSTNRFHPTLLRFAFTSGGSCGHCDIRGLASPASTRS